MKWEKPNGGVQWSADKCYSIVRATETGPIWIAYRMTPTTGEQIGTTNSDDLARDLCEDDWRQLESLRKRA
jgi:hypothetical protein